MNSPATSVARLRTRRPAIIAWLLFSRKNRRKSFLEFCNTICQYRTFRHSFDHCIGACKQQGRNGQAERFGRLEIDHQLKLYRHLDRKFTWPRALENTIDIGRCAPKIVELIDSVGQ